jgi:LAO/AO transport system kinase
MSLVDALLQGDRLALARTLTQIENSTPESQLALDILYQNAGKAHVIGITGPTGSGKSTLVNQLARAFRNPLTGYSPARVAILAVDPTSPFTGGAVLGDRVRMRDLSGDTGIFIRSVATRGALGGLAHTTSEMVTALDAAGYDVILVETVGAGQAEVEITRLAQTVLLVENPGMGDDIQAIKAGILEIADVIAINKADRPGVEQTERALLSMLELNSNGKNTGLGSHHFMEEDWTINPTIPADKTGWQVPLLRTVAIKDDGIPAVVQALRDHLEFLKNSGLLQINQKIRLRRNLENLIRDALFRNWLTQMNSQEYDQALERLFNREVSPINLAEEIIHPEYLNKTPAIHLK